MANKVRFGLEKVYFAVEGETAGSYSDPVPVPGAVSMSLTPQGTNEKFYADNMPYLVIESNDGYQGDIEVAFLPDSLRTSILGDLTDDNGMIVEDSDAVGKKFALLFQILGDEANRRYAFFGCYLSRPTEVHKTKSNSITPDTQTLTLTATPVEFDNVKCVKASLENTTATKTVYDAWYTAVTVPTFT